LPRRQIHEADVARWLRDSRLQATAIHYTTPEHAAAIREGGVRIQRGTRGPFGQGFYAVVGGGAEGFGTTPVRVAIKMVTPLVGDALTVMREIERLAGRGAPPADRRRTLMNAGYDGIIIDRADGRRWVVDLIARQIRVMVEERGDG
jgi:hypothetical protein